MGHVIRERLAVQLYTVRDAMKTHPWETLEAIRDMGWPAVQVSGFPYDPQELGKRLRSLELETAGIHLPYTRFANDLDGIRREAEALDTIDVVCPALPMEMRNPEGFVYAREVLRAAADRLGESGLRVSYHNHDYEFEHEVGNVGALAYMLDLGDDSRLLAEFDVYWLAHGGQEPVSFMERYRGRIPILHLKDMTPAPERTFAAVGTGVLDFAAILRSGLESGVEWYAVEQDRCPGDPLDSLKTSWKNLDTLIGQLP